MLIMRIQRALGLSDVVEIHVFFQDKLATKYTLSLSEPFFNTLAEHLCFNRAGLRLPIRATVGGKLVPRRWRLELRLEGSVDKELLDKIQLADPDPDINVLSGLPQSDAPAVEQSIRVGAQVSEAMPVAGEPKSEDSKNKAPDPIATSDTTGLDIKVLQAPKMEETKRGDRQHRAPGDKHAKPRVKIMMAEDMLEKAKEHAASSKQEVGGVLVGRHSEPKSEDDIYSVEIWDAISGKNLVSRGASVTFTADTWSTAIQQVEEKYGEDLYIIGWYHTHPGFGVFMSGYDRFIHENYFNEPWQVALVIDPYARTEGFFAWHTNDEGQTLERYPKQQIKFLEGAWPPSIEPPPQEPTEPKEPTEKDLKAETVAPVPKASEKQEGEDTPDTPSHGPATVAENPPPPSEDVSVPIVPSGGTQQGKVHRESVAQQAEKLSDKESAQMSAPI